MSFKSWMNYRIGSAATVLVAAAVFSMGIANAAPPAGSGNGNGQGGGQSGGGTSQSSDLGDLYVLLRDASGVPILTPESCRQPLAAPGVTLTSSIDGTVACTPSSSTESCAIPVDGATCGIQPGYEAYAQEVDFGRTSVVRSPSSVLDSQLEDALVNLSTADCKSLDAAGRLVTSVVDDYGVVTSAPIDSPIQNLAIYRQLMLTGYLGTASSQVELPGGMGVQHVLDTAARSLGAASDKSGKVNVDMVVYLNQILGIAAESVSTYLPKVCIDYKAEVQGVVKMVRKCYLNYGAYNFNRAANFGALPYPAYIASGSPHEGWFEYLSVLDPTPTFGIAQGPIASAVPALTADPGFADSNIRGFAQAADDTRAVIDFMHTWPVPGDYATPVPCSASPGGSTHSDVSISDKSGLEVPVRMVAGTEGREFSLTVANAGPDAATGSVTLEAITSDGSEIAGFPKLYQFDIPAGQSQAWTGTFSVDSVTTITWTATASAANDVNLGNNSVTETTQVQASGGGRGSGGGGGGGE